jgi:signal peptidase
MDRRTARGGAFSALGLELAVEVARRFGSLRLRVTGTSMLPAIQPGDLLSIGRVELRETSPGEIVLFARGGRLFAHRIVDRGGGSGDPYLVTRGDRLVENDPPVFQSGLLGRVTAIERGRNRVRPRPWLDGPNRVLPRLLRSSDRATVLFLRLTALWRASSLG